MKFSFFLLLTLSIFTTSCLHNEHKKTAQDAADEIKDEFVPDGRVAFFEVKVQTEKEKLIVIGETNIPEAKEALLKKLATFEGALVDSVNVLPLNVKDSKNYGVVRLSVCNIRSNPKHSAELSTQSTLGSPLRVYKKQGDWFYVQTPDNYLGWLDKDGFTAMNKEEFEAWQTSEKVIITKDTKAITSANATSQIVSDLLPGNILQKKGKQKGFEKIGFPDGREGYVAVDVQADLKTWLSETKPDTTRIFQIAKRMMGSPYLWGGTSTKGMDCSGYTKQIFFENGLLLPRDASQQVRVGQEIETDTTLANLLPGDLLFFGRKATAEQKERIWHVAIYLGNGKIIHSAGNVKIQSLRRADEDFAEDRLETFVRAKRILGSEGKNGVEWLRNSPLFTFENN